MMYFLRSFKQNASYPTYILAKNILQTSLFEVEKVVGKPVVDIDFYVAAPFGESYGWHSDEVDNLILCVAGTKKFKISSTVVGSPPTVDVQLNPGDAVWIPAGFLHLGLGTNKQSLIWSIGFKSRSDARELNNLHLDQEFDILKRGGDYFGSPLDDSTIEELAATLLAAATAEEMSN
jgi:ribosomal protein L16 Arg81 hydroxylase